MRTGYDPEGNPTQWHLFAEFVRHALHAAADQVEPQADGLEPIRARILAWRRVRDAVTERKHPGRSA